MSKFGQGMGHIEIRGLLQEAGRTGIVEPAKGCRAQPTDPQEIQESLVQ
jgi:hypothetical protein